MGGVDLELPPSEFVVSPVIVVETNVISELMRGEPVLAWVAAQPRALLYTTYVKSGRILYGIGALSEGRDAQRQQQCVLPQGVWW